MVSNIQADWDDIYLEEIDRLEKELGREICGYPTPDCTPCIRAPIDESGRCEIHGGVAKSEIKRGIINPILHFEGMILPF